MSRYTHYFSVVAVFPFLVLVLASSWEFEFSLSENKKTMVSPGEIFELGLFRGKNIHGDTICYLGMWFRRFPDNIVWVANRESPLSGSTGTLRIYDFNLHLVSQSGSHVWKTNLTSTGEASLVAELLDNGNFVLRYSDKNRSNSDGVLWQSFDHPTDTLLPGMELRKFDDRMLRSWRLEEDDPSSGYYTYGPEALVVNGHAENYIWEGGERVYRMDPTYTTKSTVYRTTVNGDTSTYSLLRLSSKGALTLLEWTPAATEWKEMWRLPNHTCDNHNICGPNAYCYMNPHHSCKCFQGFETSTTEYEVRHRGCERKSNLTCFDDEFQLLENAKLPAMDEGTTVDPNINSDECQLRCRQSCNCTAFANTDMPMAGSSCVMWTGDLVDIRRYSTHQGQHLYVKLAARDVERNSNKKKWIIGFTLGGSFLLLLSAIFWKRKKIAAACFVSRETIINNNPPMETSDDWTSEFMEFDVIAQATNSFSDANKIGSGGFGNVYKGRLLDGQEIAVKRVYNRTDDGIRGFFNEMNFIRKLQHINLVRLLGYFYNDHEKLLVYEFLENSSLDTYLFDTAQRSMLTWDKRLDITKGIARGLVYLHQDSRFRIIHLDLKASNILLGKDMIPKISDFGMAKTLEGDDTEALASATAGTFGYMAPEYRRRQIYSAKSDVYSFGVLLLEIVSGKKTSEFSRLNDGDFFLSFIWTSWSEGKGLEMVDPLIKDSAPEQALRCIQIGLLCVQSNARDRPMMSSVVSMLGSETELIDIPKSPLETGASSSTHHPQGESSTTSNNQITVSTIVAR